MKRESTRFSPSRLSQCLIPTLLVLLVAGLVVTIVVVVLSVLGLTPGA